MISNNNPHILYIFISIYLFFSGYEAIMILFRYVICKIMMVS
jgi:hypothetical protein